MDMAAPDTSTVHFNTDKLKNISLAIQAGSHGYYDIKETISGSLPQPFKVLADWIEQDQNNLKTAKEIAQNILTFICVDDSHLIPTKEAQVSEIQFLTNQIENLLTLSRPQETLELARQVISQGQSQCTIEEWASLLANDISKGTD